MASTLCENCYKKPKFGTHRFCGKTCAAQAAAKSVPSKQSQSQGKAGSRNPPRQKVAPAPPKAIQLCAYCSQKPRFNNFDYCGKSCAALANTAQNKPPVAQGVPATKQKTTRAPTAPTHNAQAPVPAKPHKAPRPKVPAAQGDDLDSICMRLKVERYRMVDDSTEEDEEPEDEGGVSTDLDAYPSDSESEPEDVPGFPTPQAGIKGTPRGVKPGSGAPRTPPGACAISGCGQPSHVDKNGVKTAYCSKRHRE
ncbi:hypothetical protein JVU11DRAFT_6214 [Chiua virens]|nr:hypothetical protein JVU11DRAFT_6214 [Chiua virens]